MKYGKIFYGSIHLLIEIYPILIQFDVLEDFSSPFIIIPETGAQRELFVFGEVKESPIPRWADYPFSRDLAFLHRGGGFNGLSTGAASVYTAYVDNVLQSSFAVIQPDTTIKPNPEFGTYEKTSDDPLTVTYTFDDNGVVACFNSHEDDTR